MMYTILARQVYEGIHPNAYVPTQHFTLKH